MGIVLGALLFIGKVLLWAAIIFVAACTGVMLGAFFGLFMGPIKVFEWTRNGNGNTSSDSI